MHKYPGISTTKDDLISYSADSTTIKPLLEITGNHINLSDYYTTSSPTPDHPYLTIPSCRAINFMHVCCDLNKCRGTAESARHNHSYPYLYEADMELTSEDDYNSIKKEDNEMSSDKGPLSAIRKDLFKNYKAPSTNVNLTDWYNNLQIVLS